MKPTKLNRKWLNGLENPEEFEKKMIEQKELFKRFYELIDNKSKANYKERLKKDNYTRANWSELQADAIGYERCLEELKALLNYTQD